MPLLRKTFILSSIFPSVLLSYSNQYASRSSTDFVQPHSFMYLFNSVFISAFPTRHNWNSFLKNGSIFSIGILNSSEKRWLKYLSLRMIIPSVSKITAFIVFFIKLVPAKFRKQNFLSVVLYPGFYIRNYILRQLIYWKPTQIITFIRFHYFRFAFPFGC